MDRASIIAIEEVCKRCHLYTKDCGMLECPSQCVHSGHFIDGYRKAEKDLALTWEDVKNLDYLLNDVNFENGRAEFLGKEIPFDGDEGFYGEVLKRFNEQRQK